MSQPVDPMSVGDWITYALSCALMVVVLLAPAAPFLALFLIVRKHPDLWEIYWRHPWINGLLLSLTLSTLRVVFLTALSLLSRVSFALYPAVYGWYPEMIARFYLESRGWNVSPSPDEPLIRYFGIAFALNMAFWLGALTFPVLVKSLTYKKY